MDNISNIMAAIVAILNNNGLTELSLENYDELNDPAYIVWLEWWQSIHACVLEVLESDGKRRCPACGKPLQAQQKYCSETCRKFAMPQPTPQKVAELANERIRKLIARIAQGNRKLKQSLTEEYFIKL